MNFGKVELPIIPGATSLLHAFSVEESFTVIAQAKLFIAIDSGLLHIAACTRTPAVGLWEGTEPKNFYSAEFRKVFIVSRVSALDVTTGCGDCTG
jgi:ADP-heptose:LPS heptosyltransferase